MSTESATAVVERIKTDEAFRSDVIAAPDAEARYAFLNAAGFDVSSADKDVIVKGLEQAPAELSDEQLEGASGAGSLFRPDIHSPGPVMQDYPYSGW